MKLIILIILIIIFVFYIKNLPKLESFSTDEVKKNIVVHIVNYDNVNNYIDYDYFNDHILRFINSDIDSKYILKEIINVDYKNNLYNAYQHVSNKTDPAQTAPNNPSNKIKEFVENDIDFLKKNAVPEDSKESEESEDPEDSKNWILFNMLDKRKLLGNHINIIVLPKLNHKVKIDDCIITSLYDADDNKTYPHYPSDLPSKFMAIYDANQSRIEDLKNNNHGRKGGFNNIKDKISAKQTEYKEIKDQMNEMVNDEEYIDAKQEYDDNWKKIKELQSIDHNALSELNQYPNYINRDKLVYDTTCDGTDRTNCRTAKKYYDSQRLRTDTKDDIKDANIDTIATLQLKNDTLLTQELNHYNELKKYNRDLEQLDKEIGELYGELENQTPDCNAIKQIQNLNKIQNNWELFKKKFESKTDLKESLYIVSNSEFKIPTLNKTCNSGNTICKESINYVNKHLPPIVEIPQETDISIPTLPSSVPTLGSLYSSTPKGECSSGLTTNKGLAYINSSDYYLNTFKDSYI
jgi:hypothetical protein